MNSKESYDANLDGTNIKNAEIHAREYLAHEHDQAFVIDINSGRYSILDSRFDLGDMDKFTYDYDHDVKHVSRYLKGDFYNMYLLISSIDALRMYLDDEDRRELIFLATTPRGNIWFRCIMTVLDRKGSDVNEILFTIDRLDRLTGERLSREKKQNESSSLVEWCVNLFSEEQNTDVAINKLLEMMLEYYCADRVYYCEIEKNGTSVASLYEKRREGINMGFSDFLASSSSVKGAWMALIGTESEIMIPDTTSGKVFKDPLLSRTILEFNIKSIMVEAYRESGRIAGLIGVDNATENNGDPVLLRTVTTMVQSETNRRYRSAAAEAETNSVIAGLAGNFEEIVYVKTGSNFTEDRADMYRTSEAIAELIPEWRTLDVVAERFELLKDNVVLPEDREQFWKNTNRRNILKGMMDASAYIVNFRALIKNEIRTYQMRFVPTFEKDGKIKGYVCGINNIDAELSIEREHSKAREEIINVIRALSAEYENVYYYNPVEDVLTGYVISKRISDMLGSKVTGVSYTEMTEAYVSLGVLDSEKAEFRRTLALENIRERLKNAKMFTKVYLNNENRYCEVKVASTGNKDGAFVIGFAIKDEEIRSARRQENTLYESISVLCEEGDHVKAINTFLRMATEYFDAGRTAIFERSVDGNFIEKTYEYATEEAKKRPGPPPKMALATIESIASPFFTSNDPIICRRGEDGVFPFERFPGLMNCFLIPMKVNAELLGIIGIFNSGAAIVDPLILRTTGAFCLNEILRRKQYDEEHLVLNEIAGSFEFVAYADFEADLLRVYRIGQRRGLSALNVSTYSEFIKICIEGGVANEDRARFKIMTSVGYLEEQFKKKTMVGIGFVADTGDGRRNYEIQFIRGNTAGTRAVVIVADNTDIIRHETDIQNQLKEAKEQAESASRAKSEFLSRMSHDIRTPINGVIGMTDIARKYIDDKERVKDSLEKIHVASGHLLSLLNDVLDMSVIESGKTIITKNPFNIRSFADNCCTILESQVQEKGISFVRDYDAFVNEEVIGDEIHIRRALLNILGNAVKFTPPGGTITFRVKQVSVTNDEEVFRFEVQDTGKGMKMEFLEHIWEPFAQEDTSVHTTYRGSGLGMAICKQLTDMMGGSVSVKSTENVGTTFTVELPLSVNKSLKNKAMNEAVVDIRGAHILVAEDNAINIEIVQEILTSEGAVITLAENGEEALKEFEKSKEGFYDLILMDIMMPVMDGLEAAEKIRKLERSDASVIPIVAMTANAFDEDIKKSRAAGMDAHLSKPIQVPVMLKTMSFFIHEGRKSDKHWNMN